MCFEEVWVFLINLSFFRFDILLWIVVELKLNFFFLDNVWEFIGCVDWMKLLIMICKINNCWLVSMFYYFC